MTKSICVYCGSSDSVAKDYFDLADALGREIAENNIRLVYGGGGVGLMGACARAAYKSGGDVLGIIPKFLLEYEKVYEDVPHQVVENMTVRKQLLFEESDAFIVLPGGIGTLEEVIEVLSWAKLDLHAKPVVFLDNDGYWGPLLDVFTHLINKGFIPESFRRYYIHTTSAPIAVSSILAKTAP